MTLNSQKSTTHLALLILRVMVGVVFIYHGGSKIFSEGGMAGFAGYLEMKEIPALANDAQHLLSANTAAGVAIETKI